MKRTFLLLLLVSLLAAACGDATAEDGTTADLPPAAGTCLEGTEDCNDTPADGGGLPLADDGAVGSDGFVVDGGLTVSEALATDAGGVIAVQGFVLGDDTGWRLCEALAESFPPQCGGPFLVLADFDSPPAQAFLDEFPVEEEQTTRWLNDSITLLGEVIDGTLVIDLESI